MRAAPAVCLETAGSAGWRWALRALLGLTLLATLAWAASRPAPSSAAVAVTVLGYALGLGWQTRRPRRWRLDWDGKAWQLSGGARGSVLAGSSRAARLSVALDFGDALLLRATTDDAGAATPWRPLRILGRHSVWLPLQRRDHAAQWHALRCALHAPPRQG
jgi:hypothetical protein